MTADRPVEHLGRAVPSRVVYAAYVSAGLAWTFALVSAYWALGGEAGISTLGGRIEQLARERDRALMIANGVGVFAKMAGGLVALALVSSRRGLHPPPRWLVRVAMAGSLLLVVYGLLQVVGVGLALAGLTSPEQKSPTRVLLWRLLLWEPWFLFWGLTLAVPTLYRWREYRRSPLSRSRAQPAR